jgi:hypothetical protein
MQFKVGDRVRYIGGAYTAILLAEGVIVSPTSDISYPWRVDFGIHKGRPCRLNELELIESSDSDVVSTPDSPQDSLILDPDYKGPYTTYEVVEDNGEVSGVYCGLEECLSSALILAQAYPSRSLNVVRVLNTHLFRIKGNAMIAYPQNGDSK